MFTANKTDDQLILRNDFVQLTLEISMGYLFYTPYSTEWVEWKGTIIIHDLDLINLFSILGGISNLSALLKLKMIIIHFILRKCVLNLLQTNWKEEEKEGTVGI